MNSDEENKQNKKEQKEIKKEKEIEQKTFSEINKNLEESIAKLDEINSNMDSIIYRHVPVYDRIGLGNNKEKHPLLELGKDIKSIDEKVKEALDLNSKKIIPKKESNFSKIKNYLIKNRTTIDNYLITPALTVTSIPAGMLYANRKENKWVKGLSVLYGVVVSMSLTLLVASTNLSEPETKIYENDNIEISYKDSYHKANYNNNYSNWELTKDLAIIGTTNYGILEVFNEPEKNAITKVNIHSKKNLESISANYEFDGFVKVKDLDIEKFNDPKTLNVNGWNVDEYHNNRNEYIDEVKEIYKNNKPKVIETYNEKSDQKVN